jgi:hypothetical protein
MHAVSVYSTRLRLYSTYIISIVTLLFDHWPWYLFFPPVLFKKQNQVFIRCPDTPKSSRRTIVGHLLSFQKKPYSTVPFDFHDVKRKD